MSNNLGWWQIYEEVDKDGNPTPLAKAVRILIDNGCSCDCDEDDETDEGYECDMCIMEAALKEQFDKITLLEYTLNDLKGR